MKRKNNILLILAAFTIVSCQRNSTPTEGKNECNYTFEYLKDSILHQSLSKVSQECSELRDTTLEGDEGVKWNGKAFYRNNSLIFLAESNWEDTSIISRITVFDPSIQYRGTSVNQRYSELRNKISPTIVSAPDGYFFLSDRQDSSVIFQMDISQSKDSILFYGTGQMDKIPDDLKIETIVIM